LHRLELRSMGISEPPWAMIFQFLPPFVLRVEGKPEGARVRDVNRHGHVQFAAPFPDGIEPRVIDSDQLAFAVTQEEAEALVFLEPRRAEAMSFLDLFHRTFREIGLVPAFVIEIHVLKKSTGSEPVGKFLVSLECGRRVVRAPCHGSSAQIHRNADADGIHQTHRSREMLRCAVDMLVQIDDPVFKAPSLGLAADFRDILLAEAIDTSKSERRSNDQRIGGSVHDVADHATAGLGAKEEWFRWAGNSFSATGAHGKLVLLPESGKTSHVQKMHCS